MTTLIFFITFLALVIFLIRAIVKAIRRKPFIQSLGIAAIIVSVYAVAWFIFYAQSKYVPVPLSTAICFDDWCATVTQVEESPVIQKQFSSLDADSTWIILHIQMINQAKGIAQKPSEPRIHILDDGGHAWAYSARGQQLLEKKAGTQVGIDQRLELHQSLQTMLAYAVPRSAKNLQILIEEGPFITKLLFPADQEVFIVNPR